MIRLLLIDNHAVVREGVKRILAGEPDIVVAAEAACAHEVSKALGAGAFDLVVLDISLPDHSGLDILNHLHTTHPDLPVLIFTEHSECQYVVHALKDGATGYLLKSCSPQELITAIRQLCRGERYISAALVNHLVHEVAETERPLHATLSPREDQVLRLLAAGKALKEIAYELGLSVKTVSTHRRRVLNKLRLHTTAELVRYALRHGLTE
jgi:two-component system invasion response regulator UvrY